jgi:vanadium-dependent haloperoxidase-like protein/uncharacterized protein DUF6851
MPVGRSTVIARGAMALPMMIMATTFAAGILVSTPTSASVVSEWNATALGEVRASKALRNGPPVVARALAIVHTCIYDAWAQYDGVAVGTVLRLSPRPTAGGQPEATKATAVSFAGHRCLRNLYPDAAAKGRLDAALTASLAAHGYDAADPYHATAAAVGTAAAQAVIDARANDGSNQYGNAPCPAGDVCPTVPVIVFAAASCTPDPPPTPVKELLGVPASLRPLPCLGPGGATAGPYADYDDPASGYQHYVPSNPLMGYCTPPNALPILPECPAADPYVDAALPWPNVADPSAWQPLVFVNHSRQTFVGAHFGRVSPFALISSSQFDDTLALPPPDFLKNDGQYQKDVNELVKYSRDLDDTRKLIVEYWADGPDSELPPGHWGLFAQFVSARDHHTIDQDAKMFFAMHNASFDAGVVAWHIKRKYNGVRPITAIRYARQGQTIRAWGGPGRPTENIPGERWMPYNPGTNLTPPFPGYFSGHSVFSRSSATVLQRFTGSDAFNFSTVIPAHFGRVEPGIPAVPTTMSFATFSDAADAAGRSRLYGGIHFPDDNTTAQAVGRLIGEQAWARAQTYFNGTAP